MGLRVHLDYETFSECDLKACGASVYAQHPSTHITHFSIIIENDQGCSPVYSWVEADKQDGLLETIRQLANHPAVEWVAHNAAFERAVWAEQWERKLGIPLPPLERWTCTMANAMQAGAPGRLEDLTKALGVPDQKDTEGGKIMAKHSKPRKPSKKDPSTRWPDPDRAIARRVMLYNAQDVRAEVAAEQATPFRMSANERAVWQLTQRMNERGVPVDREGAEAFVRVHHEATVDMLRELDTVTGGDITSVDQIARIKAFCARNGLQLEGLAADILEELDFDAIQAAHGWAVRRVLEIRQTIGKSSVKKLPTILRWLGRDDRIRGALSYYGAMSTGRWSSQGPQFQNFGRPLFKLKGDMHDAYVDLAKSPHATSLIRAYGYEPMEYLVTGMRHLIAAPAGSQLAASDFASIESVCLFALAGAERKVELLRSGQSLYVDLASKIYGRPISKEGDLVEYSVGKIAVLGLGYQMGPPKYQETCRKQGVIVSLDLAEKVVKDYRQDVPEVAGPNGLWKCLEGAALAAMLHPGGWHDAYNVGYRFDKDRDILECMLPSGRSLYYWNPRVDTVPSRFREGELDLKLSYNAWKEGRWQRVHTYGGKLAENVIQAIARDLMALAMLRLEDAGCRLILTVHDEAVDERPGADHQMMEQIMAEPVSWAKGWPIRAEGWTGPRFRK